MHFSIHCMLVLKTIILKARLFEKCLKTTLSFHSLNLTATKICTLNYLNHSPQLPEIIYLMILRYLRT